MKHTCLICETETDQSLLILKERFWLCFTHKNLVLNGPKATRQVLLQRIFRGRGLGRTTYGPMKRTPGVPVKMPVHRPAWWIRFILSFRRRR